MEENKSGWGVLTDEGDEIWDAPPTFTHETVTVIDRIKMLFYPKKFVLYRAIARHVKEVYEKEKRAVRILDVGCGTGGAVIDLKKLFGEKADVIGIDVVQKEIDMAKRNAEKYSADVSFSFYNGTNISYENESFDIIYTSDVLGHVQNVSAWLREINRVLKSNGLLAMFNESKLGKHAYIRKYLLKHGLNTDPHAQYHISLYGKQEMKERIEEAGFDVKRMYGVFWAKFLVHPDELYPALHESTQFPVLRRINAILYHLKRITKPVSLAVAELYGLIEMYLIGRWVESQGYVVVAFRKTSGEKEN